MARKQVVEVVAEMVASVVEVGCAVGDDVTPTSTVLLLESMKMEIPVHPEHAGRVREIKVAAGDVIQEGDVLVVLDPA
ncbi:biotin/lipoyl-binding carrier protein [Nocardioides sp. ChNu-153]|uniref:biotin/lipoyl-binding carrier protein n=1 Tax=unclassified Nocardioides TaxID=2615069 RepID=UPI0024063BED|nr:MULTISPECIES: biotin/lipoyl-binding carrier protein [unclassified Nocardioides]MDF9714905.1 biotin/lipoyl-binding carrier protein [Nocardioides sp. ChNu-99]MDN7123094.1 biotin/lipoyl-binding carrier protein [Nocardioides sp. ChNu-153]